MASSAFYRREAEVCRAQAAAIHDSIAATHWLRIAADYALADAIAAEERKDSAALIALVPMQRRPIQQQPTLKAVREDD